MAAVDSEAHFEGRMATIGITPAVMVDIRRLGWNTMAAFSYVTSYVPGANSDDSAFVTGVLERLLGADHPDSPDAPRLRRLYVESHILTVQDLRRRAERPETDPGVKLPAEERVVRIAKLRRSYPGIDITGVLEPSHLLVDLLAGMLESGQIRYVHWSACTTRSQEIHGVKKLDNQITSIVADKGTGFLKQTSKPEEYVAELVTEMHLMQALQRRAFAFELAGLCPYAVFNDVTTRFFKEMNRLPLRGYKVCSLEQVENADRHIFTRLAELTTGGLAKRPDGIFPVAEGVSNIVAESEFTYLLMQMSGAQSSSSASRPLQVQQQTVVGKKPKSAARGDSRSRSRRKRVTEDQQKRAALNRLAREGKGAKGKGRGKGKGKGKGRSEAFRMMDPLIETNMTANGEPICFGYQDGSCNACQPGQRCPRGWHQCWKIACTQNHRGMDHR